jgi:hypothetical protein
MVEQVPRAKQATLPSRSGRASAVLPWLPLLIPLMLLPDSARSHLAALSTGELIRWVQLQLGQRAM